MNLQSFNAAALMAHTPANQVGEPEGSPRDKQM
jgi:hypothetical protein